MSNATATPARAEEPSTSAAVGFGDLTYVRKVGAAIGVTPQMLPESAVQEINNNVTYLLRNVIAGSLRFAAHSRRARLIPEDVDAHLALERNPAQYGFKPRDFVALRLAGCGGKEVFVEEDQEIELKSIYTASAPKIPPLPYIKAHWLAIDGEQPAVPENPVPPPTDPAYGRAETSQHVDDAQEDANRLLNMVRGGKVTEQVNVKTTTTHTLSLEQQVYYKEITEAIMGADDNKRTEALHSLRTDAGLQPLLSRFSIAIAEGVRCNIVQHNLAFLIYLMRMLQSLVNNPAISLDKCLHEMLPAILSCILSRQVCARPESDNHWALREFAGRLLAEVCNYYRKHHAMDVQSRIIDVLQQVWTKSAPPVGTVYGSLYALNEFGLETIRCVVVPHIPSLHTRLQAVVADRSDPGERLAAERTMSFATKVMISYVRQMRPTNLSTFQDYQDLLGGFADPVYRVVAMDIPQTTRTLAATRTQSSHRLAPQQQQQQPQTAPRILQRQGTSSGYSTPVQSRSGTPVSRQVISNTAQVRYTTANPNVVRRPLTNQAPSTVPRPPQ